MQTMTMTKAWMEKMVTELHGDRVTEGRALVTGVTGMARVWLRRWRQRQRIRAMRREFRMRNPHCTTLMGNGEWSMERDI